MTKVSKAALIFTMNQLLPDNDQQEISAEDLRNVLTDMIDSLCSNSGEVNISGRLRYSTDFILDNNLDLVYKSYVDDLITALNAITQGTNTLTEPLILNGNPIQTNNDIEITDITKGIIMTDQDGSGNRYRITILGASFNFELLP